MNQVLATGDGAHGVRTAAFNLPNDERIVQKMGSKRVMLKNVQEAKFSKTLQPIAKRVLAPEDQGDLSFNAFFTHILAHEMTHGIGPQNNVRQSLKELHSAIEEAKADATGLFMMQYLFDHKLLPAAEKSLYTTFLASSFRTLRFGVHEAHGKGMALQFNYLMDKGAFVARPDGTFAVDFAKIQPAVRDLVHDLLTIEATGDYAGAKKMLDELGVLRPALQQALAKLTDIPTDIEPTSLRRLKARYLKPSNFGGRRVLARHGFGHAEGNFPAGVGGGRLLREFLAHRRSSLAVGAAVERDADFQAMLGEVKTRVHDHAQHDQHEDDAKQDRLLHDLVKSAPMRRNFS